MNDVEKAEGVFVGMALAAMALVAVLVWLDMGKAQHVQAGGHEPTPQEECYQLPGEGELATFPSHSFTYCNQ